jgi:hypothetical protein
MRVHLSTSEVIRRTVSAAAAGAIAFAMLGTSALAAPPVVHDRVASSMAGASNEVCDGPICTSTSVFVIVNGFGGQSEACLSTVRYDQGNPKAIPLALETGCAPLAEGVFSIDAKGLSGATLSPIDIMLVTYACDATSCEPTSTTRVARVSATYTGVGAVSAFRSSFKSTIGGCTMWSAGKGSSREATATLAIGSASLDATGSLFASADKFKVICH